MSGIHATFGAAAETTYGTYQAPNHWLELTQEAMKLKTGRIESKSIGRGRMLRADRWVVDRQGAGGTLDFEVQSIGFQFWLQYMLGNVTSVTNTDGTTTWTATHGALNGKSFTFVANRPFSNDVLQPFAYVGCKMTDWELDAAVGSLLTAKVSIEAQDEDTSQTLATPTFETTPSELLACNAVTATVAGTTVDFTKVTLKSVSGLDATRRFMTATGTGVKEALEAGFRTIAFSGDLEFTDMTAYNRVSSATRAGALAALNLSFAGHDTIGTGSAVASLGMAMPAVRFDGDAPTISGPQLVKWTVNGVVLAPTDGSEPITTTYVTADTTL